MTVENPPSATGRGADAARAFQHHQEVVLLPLRSTAPRESHLVFRPHRQSEGVRDSFRGAATTVPRRPVASKNRALSSGEYLRYPRGANAELDFFLEERHLLMVDPWLKVPNIGSDATIIRNQDRHRTSRLPEQQHKRNQATQLV